MSHEVLQQALEAQERMKLSRDYARLPGYPLSDADRQMEKSTAALREALAQPDQEYDRGFSNGWDKCAARQVTQPALPTCYSDDADAFIEKHLALRNYPANSRNAARAGWDAACDLLTKIAQPVQPEPWTPADTAYRPGGLAQPEQTHSQNPKFTMDEWAAHARKHQWRFDEEPVTGVATMAQQKHPEQMARLGWQYVECPACGSEGARAFPKPEEQPVAWMHKIDCDPDDRNDFMAYYKRTLGYCIPLYTSPPQRQPLTDDEIDNIVDGFSTWMFPVESQRRACDRAIVRAIEAAHNIGDKT